MVLGPQDLVISRGKDGTALAAGFPIDSTAASHGGPAILLKGGSGTSNGVRLSGFAVPAALCAEGQGGGAGAAAGAAQEDGGVLPDGLVDRLISLASAPAAPRKRMPRTTKRRSRQALTPRKRPTRRRRPTKA
jgi:hypothetical protein